MWRVKCEVWSVKFEVWSAKSAVCSVRCGVSREGHGRDRLSLNYRSFIFGKLPPPACPGLCYMIYNNDIYGGGVGGALSCEKSRDVLGEQRNTC